MTSPVPPGQDHQDQSWATENHQSEQPRQPGFGRGRLGGTIAAAVVVLIGAAASVWWFSGRDNQPDQRGALPPVSTPRHTPRPRPTPPTTTQDTSAYGAGTCLIEPADPANGGLEISPVPCVGNTAVLIINQVVAQYGDCQNSGDYVNHGFILTDEVANVTYCVSLVVPANQCFEFSTDNSKPIQRAACGSAPNVVRVESIEPAASVSAACADQTTPDIWYYQSPTSGQYACVSSLPPGASSTSTPPTS